MGIRSIGSTEEVEDDDDDETTSRRTKNVLSMDSMK